MSKESDNPERTEKVKHYNSIFYGNTIKFFY